MKGNQVPELVEPSENMVHQILEAILRRQWMVNADEISQKIILTGGLIPKSIPESTYSYARIREPRGIEI